MKIRFKTIRNLSDEKLIDGIQFSFENSEYLYNSAIILKRNKKFGAAISILTLSIEESVKAMTLFVTLITRNEPNSEEFLSDLFDSRDLHSDRLEFALVMSTIFRFLTVKRLSKISFKTPEDYMSKIVKIINSPKVLNAIEDDKKALNNWFLQANTRKNSGLYVSFDNKWLQPELISEAEFINALKETKTIRNHLKILSQAFSDPDRESLLPIIRIWKQMSVGIEKTVAVIDTAANSRHD